jgi:hypothetical protein
MSFTYVRLIQIKNDTTHAEYIITSVDFNSRGEWEPVGQILINKKDKTYEFQPSRSIDAKIIPPTFFALSKAEREILLGTKYKDFGWSVGSLRVHHWATAFIEEGFFPECFPPNFSF